jgi:hypothetical protein
MGLGANLTVGLGAAVPVPVPVDPLVDPLLAAAFALDWTTPAPPPHPDNTHADNTEADASTSGRYQLRFRACVHLGAVLIDSLSIKNVSRRISHSSWRSVAQLNIAEINNRNDRRSMGASQMSPIDYIANERQGDRGIEGISRVRARSHCSNANRPREYRSAKYRDVGPPVIRP